MKGEYSQQEQNAHELFHHGTRPQPVERCGKAGDTHFLSDREYWMPFTSPKAEVRGVEVRLARADPGSLRLFVTEDSLARPSRDILVDTKIEIGKSYACEADLRSVAFELRFPRPVPLRSFLWIGFSLSEGLEIAVERKVPFIGFVSVTKEGCDRCLERSEPGLQRPRLTAVY